MKFITFLIISALCFALVSSRFSFRKSFQRRPTLCNDSQACCRNHQSCNPVAEERARQGLHIYDNLCCAQDAECVFHSQGSLGPLHYCKSNDAAYGPVGALN